MLDKFVINIQGLVLQDYGRYKMLESLYRKFKPSTALQAIYPTDINLEITSYCNAKCVFCTHDYLIKSGGKAAIHMDLTTAQKSIDRIVQILDRMGVADNVIRFSPVGLGEPLLHPNFFEIVAYARRAFPRAEIHMNSNGLVLKGDRASRLIDCGVDRLIVSLCFNDPVRYKESMGVDRYAVVVEQIQQFLREKGNRAPRTIIHIFDVPENQKRFAQFIREWTPWLNRNDFAGLYHYVPLVDWSPTLGDKAPCSQLWNVMMVDASGYVFPCCIGVWTQRDRDLCLGRIQDPLEDLIAQLNRVRKRHLAGDYGVCNGCGILTTDVGLNRQFQERMKLHPEWILAQIPDPES